MLTRPFGISITAVLILIASGVILIIGIYSLAASVLAKDLGFSFVSMMLGGWGTATGVGILLLRRWARLSILMFSVTITSWAFLAAPIILFYPIPTPTDVPEAATAAVMSVLPVLVALLLAFA